MSKEAISPYARLNLGAVITQQSLIKVTGQHNTSQGPADVPIYIDDSPDRVHPYVGLGLGITAAAGKGYQLRLEIRDNYVRLPIPAGPTIHEALMPETTTKGKHVFSLMIGFDIVLERKRGHAVLRVGVQCSPAGGATRMGGVQRDCSRSGGRRILDRVIDALVAALGAPPLLVANAPEATGWAPELRGGPAMSAPAWGAGRAAHRRGPRSRSRGLRRLGHALCPPRSAHRTG